MDITYDPGNETLIRQLARSGLSTKHQFLRRQQREKRALSVGFEELFSLKSADVTLLAHQQEAVRRVLSDMRGRAILADEVGLGKTLEAGTVVKEYLHRGIIQRVLILVPPSLITQWQDELKSRLHLSFPVGRNPADFTRHDRLIASLDTAKREPNAAAIHGRSWHMVIVDEAHRLKNHQTINWQFVNRIKKSFLLLLTATPIQNNLKELYNLVTLLKPGQLKTFAHFKRRYMLDQHRPKNVTSLKEALEEVMVRTCRREANLDVSPRIVRSEAIQPTDREREFYRQLVAELRRVYRLSSSEKRTVLPLILLLRQATSHPRAAIQTMGRMAESGNVYRFDAAALDALKRHAGHFVPAKLVRLQQFVRSRREPIIVFTEFRESQAQISRSLRDDGQRVWCYHGGLSRDEKNTVIEGFRHFGGVFVSTEAGGEGLNLQFCRLLVNYDLPWNPMKVEQRIGRVHRLGQSEPVEVMNLMVAETIEAYVVDLLEKKVDLFQKVVGEVDAILSSVEDGWADRIVHAFLSHRSETMFWDELHRIGEKMEKARASYEALQRRNDVWLDEALPPTI